MRQELFGPVPPRYADYARSIHEAGGHLLDLINDVLDVSRIEADRYELALESFDPLAALGQWLAQPGDWVGGFDLPFGLPRELVQTLGWPTEWRACMQHYLALSRAQIRDQFAAFCAARPVGGK